MDKRDYKSISYSLYGSTKISIDKDMISAMNYASRYPDKIAEDFVNLKRKAVEMQSRLDTYDKLDDERMDRIRELEAVVRKICVVNAMDYEYQNWAREVLNK